MDLHVFLGVSDGFDHLPNLKQVPANNDGNDDDIIRFNQHSVLFFITHFVLGGAHEDEGDSEHNDDDEIDNISLVFEEPALRNPSDHKSTLATCYKSLHMHSSNKNYSTRTNGYRNRSSLSSAISMMRQVSRSWQI